MNRCPQPRRHPARRSLAALALACASLGLAGSAVAAEAPRGDLILGGSEQTEAPWEAAVFVSGANSQGQCSGSVIGDRWILTAAHCLTEVEGLSVGEFLPDLETIVVVGRAALPNLGPLVNADNDAQADQIADEIGAAFGENYYIADGWNPVEALLQFDVALIRLDRDLPPELGAAPARVDQDESFSPGAAATISGWGITESGSVSPTLKSVATPVRDPNECNELVGFGFTPGRNLCAGTPAPTLAGPCKGDSGGPLTAVDPWGASLIGGISSFGSATCAEQPSAFTRVTAFSSFVADVLRADPVAPAAAPELDELDLTPGGSGVLAMDAELDANRAATDIQVEFTPAAPAAPILRSARGGGGNATRTVRATIDGLAPGVTYAWTSHASSVMGRTAGPTGTVTTPGTPLPIEVNAATRRCLPVPEPRSLGGSGSISLSRRQLAINQRIGQAALRRLEGVENWIDAGIRSQDICGASIGSDSLVTIELGRAATPTNPGRLPSPRPVDVSPLGKVDLSRFTVSPRQLRTNQRIYQVALRRARALRERLRGGLTGGDIRDGELDWEVLPPGSMMTRFAPAPPTPASKTRVAPRPKGAGKRIRVTEGQLRINQKIAQAAVREANALRREIESGLTGGNFAKNSISSQDFVPEIAQQVAAGQQ